MTSHSILDTLLPDRKNKTCTGDEGRLLLSILQFSGVNNIFPITNEGEEESMSASIERFCVNDLLRWILVHASASPTSTVEKDFEIFKLCMKAIPSLSRQKQIWETILRELIKSYCDYTALAVGLRTLVSGGGNDAELVRCDKMTLFF